MSERQQKGAHHGKKTVDTVFSVSAAAAEKTEDARLPNIYGKKLKVHLKIDTGMHRLGIPADRKEEVARVFNYRNLVITGIFTHLCAADVRTAEKEKFTMGQAAAFDCVICDLNQRGLNCGKIHLLSSDGLLQYPELAGDYARVGIALYGVLSQGADMEGLPHRLPRNWRWADCWGY